MLLMADKRTRVLLFLIINSSVSLIKVYNYLLLFVKTFFSISDIFRQLPKLLLLILWKFTVEQNTAKSQ